MDLTNKWRFLRDDALPSLAAATFPYLASLFRVIDSKTGVHEGTALRCILSGQRCLATALHVIEEAAKGAAGIAVSAGYGSPPHWIEGPVRFNRAADVAVVPLPDDYPDISDSLRFWPEAFVEPASPKRSTDYLFVHGFPCEQSQIVPLGVANRSFPYGAMEMLPEDGLPENLGPRHFGIHFGVDAMRPQAPAWVSNPKGLSGSPVWRLGLSGRSAASWSPEDCRLVGVVIECWDGPELGGRHFLLATDSASLLEVGARSRLVASHSVAF
jgi:hypothetical protein